MTISWIRCKQENGLDWYNSFTLKHLEVISDEEKQGALVSGTKFLLLLIEK